MPSVQSFVSPGRPQNGVRVFHGFNGCARRAATRQSAGSWSTRHGCVARPSCVRCGAFPQAAKPRPIDCGGRGAWTPEPWSSLPCSSLSAAFGTVNVAPSRGSAGDGGRTQSTNRRERRQPRVCQAGESPSGATRGFCQHGTAGRSRLLPGAVCRCLRERLCRGTLCL